MKNIIKMAAEEEEKEEKRRITIHPCNAMQVFRTSENDGVMTAAEADALISRWSHAPRTATARTRT